MAESPKTAEVIETSEITSVTSEWIFRTELAQARPIARVHETDKSALWLIELPRDLTEGRRTVSVQTGHPDPTTESWLNESRSQLTNLTAETSQVGFLRVPTDEILETVDLLLALLAQAIPQPELGIGRKGQVTLDWWGEHGRSITAEVHKQRRIIFATSGDDFPLRGAVRLPENGRLLPPALMLALRDVLGDADSKGV